MEFQSRGRRNAAEANRQSEALAGKSHLLIRTGTGRRDDEGIGDGEPVVLAGLSVSKLGW